MLLSQHSLGLHSCLPTPHRIIELLLTKSLYLSLIAGGAPWKRSGYICLGFRYPMQSSLFFLPSNCNSPDSSPDVAAHLPTCGESLLALWLYSQGTTFLLPVEPAFLPPMHSLNSTTPTQPIPISWVSSQHLETLSIPGTPVITPASGSETLLYPAYLLILSNSYSLEGQGFKSMSLWRPFSFETPQGGVPEWMIKQGGGGKQKARGGI